MNKSFRFSKYYYMFLEYRKLNQPGTFLKEPNLSTIKVQFKLMQ